MGGDLSPEQLKQNAGAWQQRYDKEIESALTNPDSNVDDILEIAWQDAVLGRIAPLSPAEKQARQALRKEVWEGTRNDPELYVRMLFALEGIKHAIEKRWTLAGTGFVAQGVHDPYYRMMRPEYGEQYLSREDDSYDELQQHCLSFVEKKIRKELKRLKADDKIKVPEIGSIGEVDGMKVKIERYSDKGVVEVGGFGELKTIEERRAFFALQDAVGGINPERIDPNKFELPPIPDHFEYISRHHSGGGGIMAALKGISYAFEEVRISRDGLNVADELRKLISTTDPEKKYNVKFVYDKGKGVKVEAVEL